jgi:hypothetical protein
MALSGRRGFYDGKLTGKEKDIYIPAGQRI